MSVTIRRKFSLMPLAPGIGESAQTPPASAGLGDLTASTAMTLLLIPVVYAAFFRDREALPANVPGRKDTHLIIAKAVRGKTVRTQASSFRMKI